MTREKRAYKLGCCYLALGHLAPAEAQFREGLDADANHGGCHYGLARVALLRDDHAGAIERLEATLKNDPAWKTPRELLTRLRAEGARDRFVLSSSTSRVDSLNAKAYHE